ncbi:HXXEE domain-containing protein [Propioniciclava flava]
MASQSADAMKRVPRWVPLPEDVRERGLTQGQYEAALMVMAGLMASASVAGARTGGRSRWFQRALDAYGLHGIGHIASAVLLRRYTSGSVTSPVVVIPFWLWARKALAAEGVPLCGVKPLFCTAAGADPVGGARDRLRGGARSGDRYRRCVVAPRIRGVHAICGTDLRFPASVLSSGGLPPLPFWSWRLSWVWLALLACGLRSGGQT